MKYTATAIALLSSCTVTYAQDMEAQPKVLITAGNKLAKADKNEKQISDNKIFSTPGSKAPSLGSNFSSSLGWVLWKSDDPHLSLAEVNSLTTIDEKDQLKTGEISDGTVSTEHEYGVVYDPETRGFKKLTIQEYAAWGLKSRLGFLTEENGQKVEKGSAILVSLRDSFSYFNANQGGFAVDYTNKDGDSSWKTKGAVMMDFYLDPLYNRREDAWWGSLPYRLTFRTGVEFDRDDAATKRVDLTSVYLLGSFQANPDQRARLFWHAGPQIMSPQFLQIGVAYDHDGVTHKDDTRLILGWQPQFYMKNDLEVFGQKIGETFGINRKMIYKAGPFAQLLKPSEFNPANYSKEAARNATSASPAMPSDWYSYIPADVRLSGGSEIWKRALGTDGDLDKVFLEWKAGFAVGNSAHRYRFGYLIEGVSPVAELSKTHVGHTLFAEVGLGNLSDEYVKKQKATADSLGNAELTMTPLAGTDLGAMTVFAKYTMGQFAPEFEDHNMFQIGTRIRF